MKVQNKEILTNMDIEQIAKIRSAIEITTSLAGFELSSNEERLLLFIWLRNNLNEALEETDTKVVNMFSDYIENSIKSDCECVNDEHNKSKMS